MPIPARVDGGRSRVVLAAGAILAALPAAFWLRTVVVLEAIDRSAFGDGRDVLLLLAPATTLLVAGFVLYRLLGEARDDATPVTVGTPRYR